MQNHWILWTAQQLGVNRINDNVIRSIIGLLNINFIISKGKKKFILYYIHLPNINRTANKLTEMNKRKKNKVDNKYYWSITLSLIHSTHTDIACIFYYIPSLLFFQLSLLLAFYTFATLSLTFHFLFFFSNIFFSSFNFIFLVALYILF